VCCFKVVGTGSSSVVCFVDFLAVVPVLFGYTLAPRKRLAKNLSIRSGAEADSAVESSPTSAEVALALRVLEGCCLLYSGCRAHASQHAAVSVFSSFSALHFLFLHDKRVHLLVLSLYPYVYSALNPLNTVVVCLSKNLAKTHVHFRQHVGNWV